MRKLKLQVQMSVDGFVAGPNGQLDWMNRAMDDQLIGLIQQLTDSSDTILMGRKMTPGFIAYWEGVLQKPSSPEYDFAKKMVDMPKIVFSKTVQHIDGQNVRVENGDLVNVVTQLKQQPGKDLIVYGGAGLVSSLIGHDLIDELNLFVNPAALGEGMRIFPARKPLTLQGSKAYPSGTVVNTYRLTQKA